MAEQEKICFISSNESFADQFSTLKLFFAGHGIALPPHHGLWDLHTEPPVQKPGAVSVVADTVWTLWKDDPTRVWELLREWASQREILLEACWQILSYGLSHSVWTHESAIAELESWLVAEEYRAIAAARLLSGVLASMPSGMVDIQQRWEQSTDRLFLDRLPHVLAQLFSLDPNACLSLMLNWARNGRTFNQIILAGLRGSRLSEELPESAYSHLDANLRHLSLLVGPRSQPLHKEIQRLLTSLNNARHRTVEGSRQGTKRKKRDRASEPR